MEQDRDPLAWPAAEGYLTVRALDDREHRRVWMVQRESDGLYQVIKLLERDEALASLRQDVAAGGSEHLIGFHGLIQTSLGPGLLAEYCPGGSLGQMVAARGVLPLGEAITALAPIAQAVGWLHRQGIVHGDISPNNILLSSQGMPKLADFQETRLLGDDSTVAGTPGFMAPETTHPDHVRSPEAADCYALGACLWYLLSGKVPEIPEYRSPVSVVFSGLPDSVLDLMIDALAQDPQQRPDPEQFARTLFAAGQAEPLNWTQSVPGFATHLMATIHPGAAPRRGRRPLRARQSPAGRTPARRPRDRASRTGQVPVRHRLERDLPAALHAAGGRRLVAAGLAGVVLLALSGWGLRQLTGVDPAGNAGPPSAQVAGPSCGVQSDAQIAPCAQDSTVLLAELLRLSAARDAALNAADPTALAGVYAADSRQLDHEVSMLGELGELGLRIDGLQTSLGQLAVTARRYPDIVVIAGSSRHNDFSYRSEGSMGQDHRVKPGMSEQVSFELRHTERGWLISRVLQRVDKSGTVANDDPTSASED